MSAITMLKPIDYLIIGHVTADLQADGSEKLGGTASFAGLTAKQLGQKVGILTSHARDFDLSPLDELQIAPVPSPVTTSFKNIPQTTGRIQYCYAQASQLAVRDIPDHWRNPQIVHFGPIISELDPALFEQFLISLRCLTPQGLFRKLSSDGRVSFQDWDQKERYLPGMDAVVLSLEDLQNDERLVEGTAQLCKLLVVTENKNGARVYWNKEMRHFPAPVKQLLEDTGAGDIFAACFFHQLYVTQDPWGSARFAVDLAANSVTRRYLESIPTASEVDHAKGFKGC